MRVAIKQIPNDVRRAPHEASTKTAGLSTTTAPFPIYPPLPLHLTNHHFLYKALCNSSLGTSTPPSTPLTRTSVYSSRSSVSSSTPKVFGVIHADLAQGRDLDPHGRCRRWKRPKTWNRNSKSKLTARRMWTNKLMKGDMKQKMPMIGHVFYCRVNKYASSLRLPRYCHGEVEVDAGVNSTSTAAVVVVTAFGCTPSAQVLGSSSSTVAQSAVGTTPSSTASATTASGPGFEIVSALGLRAVP